MSAATELMRCFSRWWRKSKRRNNLCLGCDVFTKLFL